MDMKNITWSCILAFCDHARECTTIPIFDRETNPARSMKACTELNIAKQFLYFRSYAITGE
jgi:hypothetical protein